jgi:hypothetical protein
MAGCQPDDLIALGIEELIWRHDERTSPVFDQSRKGGIDFAGKKVVPEPRFSAHAEPSVRAQKLKKSVSQPFFR